MSSLRFWQWLSHLGHLVRWREWKAHKLPFFLVGMCYAALRMHNTAAADLGRMAALLVLLCLFAAFGHLANDYADREIDRVAGKQKILAGFSEPAALIALAIPGLGTIGMAAAYFDGRTLLVAVTALLVAAIYSLPPFRLKERGLLGWAAASLAQRTLPLAIVFQAFGAWDWAAVLFCTLGTILGIRHIIIHQLHDRTNDLKAGVRTIATQYGAERLNWLLIHIVFPLEVVCGFATFATMSYFEHPLGPVGLGYAALVIIGAAEGRALSPLSYTTFWKFYYVIWPLSLSVLLAVRNPLFLSVVLVSIALVQAELGEFLRPMLAASRASPTAKELSPARQPPAAADRNNEPLAAPGPKKGRAHNGIAFRKANPYPFYAEQRARGPVHRLEWANLGKNWLITHHREALIVFEDCRFRRPIHNLESQSGGPRAAEAGSGCFGLGLRKGDPPEHTRLEELVDDTLAGAFRTRLSGRIEQLADHILDGARARGGIELVSEYASAIAITILSEFLGVGITNTEAARSFLYALSLNRITGVKSEALEAEKSRFSGRLEAIFAARRQKPQDDLITALVEANQDGDFSKELIETVYLLLLGGFEATANLIGNGTLTLLRHPEQLDLLRQKPDLIETAIEELLRFESPVELSSVHYPSTDIDLSGRGIAKGEAVRVIIPSANRDENVLADADRLDITRNPCPHLTFGKGVQHRPCAPLIRLGGRIAIGKLVERLPDRQTFDPELVQWLQHPGLRALRRLPLRLYG